MAVHAKKQPEPVLTRTGVVGTIAVLAAALTEVGLPQVGGWLGDNASWLGQILLVAYGVVAAVLARRHVTPTTSPKDDDGNRLTPRISTQALETAVVGTGVITVEGGGSVSIKPPADVADAADVLARANAIHPAAQ